MGTAEDIPTPASVHASPVPSQFTKGVWVATWIINSVSIIMVNKHVLSVTRFQYPMLLAFWHMLLATAASRSAMQILGWRDTIQEHGTQQLQLQLAMIGLLFGGALAAGNAALLYISVPAVQMLKAGAPVIIYILGISLGTEQLQAMQWMKIMVVCTGVLIASHADVSLTFTGFTLQAGSIVMDALRSCFLQKVLHSSKVDASPLITLAYVAPFAAAGLVVPMLLAEGPRIIQEYQDWKSAIPFVCLSGILATTLNFVVFKIIKLTSALVTSLTGIMKDWICILAAMHLYGTLVTNTQWVGYAVAISGLVWYNMSRSTKSQHIVMPAHDMSAELREGTVAVVLLTVKG